MRRPVTPMSFCVLVLICWTLTSPPALVMARRHLSQSQSQSQLALWIDEKQVKAIYGMEILIPIIQDGKVSPYLNNAILTDQFIIPAEVDTVNLTWQAGQESYTYVFDNFTSLDQHLLYQPLLGIPARGYIPRPATVFQITIPCKGKDMGVASLLLGLTIFDQWKRPLKGTPIDLRLKKQCVAFVTSSLCRPGCRNGGTCNSHGVCECPQGYKGTLCDIDLTWSLNMASQHPSTAMCTPACQNNGTCISPATCACPPGYLGDYCEKAVCGRTCQNGGHCLQEGYCWCAVGFYGDACEYNLCNPLCQNGATCIGTNQCQCPPHYSGPLCELKDEPDRPKRSKDNKNNKKVVKKKQSDQGLDVKLRKAEKRLLKIIFRRKDKWEMKPSENITLNRMHNRTETGSLKLDERRFLIKFLTRERKHLTSKDKTKLKRFKNLIRKSKSRQNQKSPRSRRVFDD